MRVTKKVFTDLAIWMVGLGIVVGLIFPFFMLALGVRHSVAMTPIFFAACVCAGALVGGMNFYLARLVVGSRLRILARATHRVEENVRKISRSNSENPCTVDECTITVDSEDEIGESAQAFNCLVETLAHSLETQRAVGSFFEMLTSSLEIDLLAQSALTRFVEQTEADGGVVVLESAGEMRIGACQGIRDPERLLDSDPIAQAFRDCRSKVISTPQDVRLDGVLAEFRPRETLVLPATYKGICLGIVVLGKAVGFDQNGFVRAELFRQAFGLALNNAFAHQSLQRLAALDPLTGVYNRRFGLTRLHEEHERSRRADAPLGVLMMDIDHFKAVNDTYGHVIGDKVLKTVADGARSVLREGDVLIRYGGEEFLALLPAASKDDVRFIGERIRRTVEELVIPHAQQQMKVTISLGGAALSSPGVEDERTLVDIADKALYRAKGTGRNRVEMA